MKTRFGALSVASALFFAFACGDDPAGSGNTGGAGGAGGAGDLGGAGGVGDAGGAGGVAVTCEPPEPPGSSDNAGGAAGASSAGGAAGAIASALAIEGKYADDFDGHYTLTSSSWSSASTAFHIAAFSNAEHWIVARNDQANMWNPCQWSRFDWTEADGVLYYCQTAYAAESEEAARATPAADPSDPATTGCGMFSWSKLTPE